MPQTSPCKLEYILNPIYPSKDKDIKKVNSLNSIQERNNTKKTPYNVHDPEIEVEVGDKSTSGNFDFNRFTSDTKTVDSAHAV